MQTLQGSSVACQKMLGFVAKEKKNLYIDTLHMQYKSLIIKL